MHWRNCPVHMCFALINVYLKLNGQLSTTSALIHNPYLTLSPANSSVALIETPSMNNLSKSVYYTAANNQCDVLRSHCSTYFSLSSIDWSSNWMQFGSPTVKCPMKIAWDQLQSTKVWHEKSTPKNINQAQFDASNEIKITEKQLHFNNRIFLQNISYKHSH